MGSGAAALRVGEEGTDEVGNGEGEGPWPSWRGGLRGTGLRGASGGAATGRSHGAASLTRPSRPGTAWA